VDSARGHDGLGITVSYWADEAAIAAWRDHAEHAPTRARGRDQWYESFAVHAARVERALRLHENCVSDSVLPSESENQATWSPPGVVQIPASS
jgi:hypothetical protein